MKSVSRVAPIALLGVLLACQRSVADETPPDATPTTQAPAAADTRIVIQNVDLHLPEGVLRISHLEGRILPTREESLPDLREDGSWRIELSTAQVAMDHATVGQVLSAGEGAPFREAQVLGDGAGGLEVSGVFRGPLPLSFSLSGPLTVEDGALDLAPVRVRVLGVPAAGPLPLETLFDPDGARGVRLAGNHLRIDPTASIPSLLIDARVEGVRLRPDGLILDLIGEAPAADLPVPDDIRSSNFIAFQGGTLRAGSTRLEEVDLVLMDLDPSTPFALHAGRLQEQLVAGWTKLRPDGGQRVYLPDLGPLAQAASLD